MLTLTAAPDIVSANSNGGDVNVLLNSAGTAIKLSSSQNPAIHGSTVTFTAKIAASVNALGVPVPLCSTAVNAESIGTAALSRTGRMLATRRR